MKHVENGAIEKQLFVRKLFARFLVPALLSSVALAIGAAADSFYVGRAIGESGLFITGSAYPVYMIFSTLSIGMATGGAIHFSETLSEGRKQDALGIFLSTILFDMAGILILAGLGLLFLNPLIALLGGAESVHNPEFRSYVILMLLTAPVLFMQAPLQRFVYMDGSPKLSSAALVIGNIVDCTLGYVFIVVLGMGVKGSIYSTLCGAVVMEVICLSHFALKRGALRFGRFPRPGFRTACASFFTGFSTEAIYLYQFFTILVFNRILLWLSGTWAVAVYDVVYNAGSIPFAVVDAVCLSMTALVTTFRGERNGEGIRSTFRFALGIGLLLHVLMSGGLMLGAGWYCRLLGIEDAHMSEAVYAFRWYMAANILMFVNSLIACYFQNMGKERYSYLMTALRFCVIPLLCGSVLSLFGYRAFWCNFFLSELLVCAVSLPLLRRNRPAFPEEGRIFSRAFVGSDETISHLCEDIQDFLDEQGFPPKQGYFIALSVDETLRLIADAARAEGGDLWLQLTLIPEGDVCTLHIRDNAKRFNPFELSEEDEIGLRILRSQSKDFNYRQYVGFNTLTVIF